MVLDTSLVPLGLMASVEIFHGHKPAATGFRVICLVGLVVHLVLAFFVDSGLVLK